MKGQCFLLSLLLCIGGMLNVVAEDKAVAISIKRGKLLQQVFGKFVERGAVFSYLLTSKQREQVLAAKITKDADIDLPSLPKYLKQFGLEVKSYGKVFLVHSPSLGPGKPEGKRLDVVVKGFSYKGNFDGLTSKIGSLFPGLPPGNIVPHGVGFPPKSDYRISVEGDATIRDILMRLAADHRLAWCLVLGKDQVFTFRRDGKVCESRFSGSTFLWGGLY